MATVMPEIQADSTLDQVAHLDKPVLTGDELHEAEEENVAAENKAETSKSDEEPTLDVAAPKLPTKLYFLRVPKPDLSELQLQKQQLDAECTQLKEACDQALAAAKLANEYRNQRREEYQASLAQFGVSKADRDELLGRLKPLRDVNRQVATHRNQVRDVGRALPATSVAQLDKMIAELEFKQAHEILDRKTENAIIAEIKKLNKCRTEVANFESMHAQQEATKEDLTSFKASKAELEDQLKIVNEEFTIAKAQMDQKWNDLKEARAKQETVSNEFQRLKEIKDAKWKERHAARDALQSARNQFYENRRFSQNVRAMIANGQVEQAAELCSEVTEALVSDLFNSKQAYKQYVDLWDLQRRHPVSEANTDLDFSAPSKQDGKAKKAAPASMPNDVDSIVAGIMAELHGAGPAPAAKDALATAIPPPEEPRAAKPKKERAAVAAPPASAPTASASSPEGSPRKATSKATPRNAAANGSASPPKAASAAQPAAPKKAKAKKAAAAAPAAPLIDEIDDTFVQPVRANGAAQPELTEAQKKELVREQNAVKAAEAEERKRQAKERKAKKAQQAAEAEERKRQAKERKAEVQQAAEAARLKQEEEVRKAEHTRARVEREAQRQRELAAIRKEQEAKRAAAAEAKAKALRARGAAKPTSVSRAPPQKADSYATIRKYLKEHQKAAALSAVMVFILFVMALALRG